ncbi:MAG: hypothetical protein AAB420_03450 [Patescibacteria group bacterium]|mgnify:CR=1 FL=1
MNEQIPEAPELIVEHLSREAVEQKLKKLSKFRGKLGMDNKFVDFTRALEGKYGSTVVRRCELLHFVSGSGFAPEYNIEKETFFDFAGEESIEKYLRDNYPG